MPPRSQLLLSTSNKENAPSPSSSSHHLLSASSKPGVPGNISGPRRKLQRRNPSSQALRPPSSTASAASAVFLREPPGKAARASPSSSPSARQRRAGSPAVMAGPNAPRAQPLAGGEAKGKGRGKVAQLQARVQAKRKPSNNVPAPGYLSPAFPIASGAAADPARRARDQPKLAPALPLLSVKKRAPLPEGWRDVSGTSVAASDLRSASGASTASVKGKEKATADAIEEGEGNGKGICKEKEKEKPPGARLFRRPSLRPKLLDSKLSPRVALGSEVKTRRSNDSKQGGRGLEAASEAEEESWVLASPTCTNTPQLSPSPRAVSGASDAILSALAADGELGSSPALEEPVRGFACPETPPRRARLAPRSPTAPAGSELGPQPESLTASPAPSVPLPGSTVRSNFSSDSDSPKRGFRAYEPTLEGVREVKRRVSRVWSGVVDRVGRRGSSSTRNSAGSTGEACSGDGGGEPAGRERSATAVSMRSVSTVSSSSTLGRPAGGHRGPPVSRSGTFPSRAGSVVDSVAEEDESEVAASADELSNEEETAVIGRDPRRQGWNGAPPPGSESSQSSFGSAHRIIAFQPQVALATFNFAAQSDSLRSLSSGLSYSSSLDARLQAEEHMLAAAALREEDRTTKLEGAGWRERSAAAAWKGKRKAVESWIEERGREGHELGEEGQEEHPFAKASYQSLRQRSKEREPSPSRTAITRQASAIRLKPSAINLRTLSGGDRGGSVKVKEVSRVLRPSPSFASASSATRGLRPSASFRPSHGANPEVKERRSAVHLATSSVSQASGAKVMVPLSSVFDAKDQREGSQRGLGLGLPSRAPSAWIPAKADTAALPTPSPIPDPATDAQDLPPAAPTARSALAGLQDPAARVPSLRPKASFLQRVSSGLSHLHLRTSSSTAPQPRPLSIGDTAPLRIVKKVKPRKPSAAEKRIQEIKRKISYPMLMAGVMDPGSGIPGLEESLVIERSRTPELAFEARGGAVEKEGVVEDTGWVKKLGRKVSTMAMRKGKELAPGKTTVGRVKDAVHRFEGPSKAPGTVLSKQPVRAAPSILTLSSLASSIAASQAEAEDDGDEEVLLSPGSVVSKSTMATGAPLAFPLLPPIRSSSSRSDGCEGVSELVAEVMAAASSCGDSSDTADEAPTQWSLTSAETPPSPSPADPRKPHQVRKAIMTDYAAQGSRSLRPKRSHIFSHRASVFEEPLPHAAEKPKTAPVVGKSVRAMVSQWESKVLAANAEDVTGRSSTSGGSSSMRVRALRTSLLSRAGAAERTNRVSGLSSGDRDSLVFATSGSGFSSGSGGLARTPPSDEQHGARASRFVSPVGSWDTHETHASLVEVYPSPTGLQPWAEGESTQVEELSGDVAAAAMTGPQHVCTLKASRDLQDALFGGIRPATPPHEERPATPERSWSGAMTPGLRAAIANAESPSQTFDTLPEELKVWFRDASPQDRRRPTTLEALDELDSFRAPPMSPGFQAVLDDIASPSRMFDTPPAELEELPDDDAGVMVEISPGDWEDPSPYGTAGLEELCAYGASPIPFPESEDVSPQQGGLTNDTDTWRDVSHGRGSLLPAASVESFRTPMKRSPSPMDSWSTASSSSVRRRCLALGRPSVGEKMLGYSPSDGSSDGSLNQGLIGPLSPPSHATDRDSVYPTLGCFDTSSAARYAALPGSAPRDAERFDGDDDDSEVEELNEDLTAFVPPADSAHSRHCSTDSQESQESQESQGSQASTATTVSEALTDLADTEICTATVVPIMVVDPDDEPEHQLSATSSDSEVTSELERARIASLAYRWRMLCYEIDQELMKSQAAWPDTPASRAALANFVAPTTRAAIERFLEQSKRAYKARRSSASFRGRASSRRSSDLIKQAYITTIADNLHASSAERCQPQTPSGPVFPSEFVSPSKLANALSPPAAVAMRPMQANDTSPVRSSPAAPSRQQRRPVDRSSPRRAKPWRVGAIRSDAAAFLGDRATPRRREAFDAAMRRLEGCGHPNEQRDGCSSGSDGGEDKERGGEPKTLTAAGEDDSIDYDERTAPLARMFDRPRVPSRGKPRLAAPRTRQARQKP